MTIVYSKMIETPYDIMEADILSFAKPGSGEYLRIAFECLDKLARITKLYIPDFHDAPGRDDFPGWRHAGNHETIAKAYWDWLHWRDQGCRIAFGDSPDISGSFGDGALFVGDIGQVSADTFVRSIKRLDEHEVWLSVLDDGCNHIMIEPMVSIRALVE
jgi:hypothetical protein